MPALDAPPLQSPMSRDARSVVSQTVWRTWLTKLQTEVNDLDTALGLLDTSINAMPNMAGLPEYADNAAAVTGGLTNGMFYRTGDDVKVVHA